MIEEELLAVIDLGTNTFNLVIAALRGGDLYRTLDKVKEPVKLGEGGINAGRISEPAWTRGMAALHKFRSMIDSRGCGQTLAFATSAIRSASNGQEFCQQALKETGIAIQVINGNQEAALIYEGIKYGLSLPLHESVLMVDIGGGSVEFIVANRMGAQLLRSVNIGAARLLEKLQPSDPITESEQQRAFDQLDAELAGLMAEIRDFGVRTLIGSSGTYETLGTLNAYEENEKPLLDNLNGYRLETRKFRKTHRRLMASRREERLGWRGLDPMRVDMILMGSLITHYIVEKLPVEQIVVSMFALKDGIIVQHLNERRASTAVDPSARNQRETAVRELAAKFRCSVDKGDYLARIVLSLFDQTRYLHKLGPQEREWLHYACLLIDLGHLINRSGHHKHGQYVIQNSALPGFSGKELLMISNLVRYHRKSLPSDEHFYFNMLYKEDKRVVEVLAGLLRLGVNLNRAERRIITDLELLQTSPRSMRLGVSALQTPDLEMQAAEQEKALFERAFGVELSFEALR